MKYTFSIAVADDKNIITYFAYDTDQAFLKSRFNAEIQFLNH